MQGNRHWVGTWAASPAPSESGVAFNNHTLRMNPRISLGGERLRVRISNAYGNRPLAIGTARIALREKGPAAVPGAPPIFYSMGNHELDNFGKKLWIDALYPGAVQSSSWTTTGPVPLGNADHLYWSFNIGPYTHFIMLDGDYQTYDGTNQRTWQTFGQTQLAWLANDIHANPDKNILVFVHEPIDQQATGDTPDLTLNDKGGLIAIAQIETVGATGSMVVRKDLGITKLADLKGKKIANQTGSSIGNIFVDQVGPANGLKKGDFQEVRMDVNNMIAAMAAKTVDAMINVEPYNAIAEAEGLGTIIMSLDKYDKVPVFMAATPDFVDKSPDTVVAYLKCWQQVARDFKDNPGKVTDVIYAFFTSKGYTLSRDTFAKALARVQVDPGFPTDLVPGLQRDAEVLLREKKISAIPDWKKALRPDLWAKASA
jgi:ABC-type nitrate/sulfonate/bicarbonate transport system substrate-binding protein